MSIAGSSIYNKCNDKVVESWNPKQSRRRRRTTLPELLQLRETNGLFQQRRYRGHCYSSTSNPYHVASLDYLSYRGAWNPTRMQNTILVVGPGTPASTVRSAREKTDIRTSDAEEHEESSSSLSSSSSQPPHSDRSNLAESENEELDLENTEDECLGDRDGMEGDYDSDARDSDDSDNSSSEGFYQFMHSNFGGSEEVDDLSTEEETAAQCGIRTKSTKNYFPSIRHGGCINTAAWLSSDCGWRLSIRSSDNHDGVHAMETEELPTQIVTSGDDRLLKVWDVSEAMGSTSPLAGGMATLTPFSSSGAKNNFYEYKERWQSFHDSREKKHDDLIHWYDNDYRPHGTVRLLATVSTGHRGNVFHVTPLKGRPGTFATCGADGFLRLVDIERSCSIGGGTGTDGNSNSAVIHPMYDQNSDGNPQMFDPENPLAYFLRNSSGMCFSHTMLDDINVGLLCSEKGLLRFDFRLSPREQCTKSVLPRTVISAGSSVRSLVACKACAVLRADSAGGAENSTGGGSTYVFAGGSSPAVALCDLRMTVASTQQRSSGSRVLQYYKPISLSEENHVSVSGLDLSRDGKELLVSYESDQIYTFPVFPYSQSPRRAATDQLEELLSKETDFNRDDEDERLYRWGKGKRILPELAAYGAHLNRFTFLKNAKYAGPRDEYICTGSDSGHAWIYEKATGAVVSFWKADQSTCNGVVPHPTLPIFVTYGIDSTAKLWRSTVPVDSEVDDSAIGRRKHFRVNQERSYKMTPTVRNWSEVRSILENLDIREAGRFSDTSDIYPDQIPCSKVLLRRGRLARTWFRESAANSGGRLGGTNICNDLHNLPDALKGNLYTVLRSLFDDDDVPVESDVDAFKQRISLIRLRHQADSLGLRWNPTIPWMMEGQFTIAKSQESHTISSQDYQVEPSELVPEYPSDWIPYDVEMSNDPFDFRDYFSSRSSGLYADFYRDRYIALDERGIILSECDNNDRECAEICDRAIAENDGKIQRKEHHEETEEDMADVMEYHSFEEIKEELKVEAVIDESIHGGDDREEGEIEHEKREFDHNRDSAHHSNIILAETVKTLKGGGNAAFKAGNLGLAAYRYDKAIQYGSIAYMHNRKSNLDCFDGLLKNLIMTRLNMALVLLNAYFMEFPVATKQAKLALQEVSPFCNPSISENKKFLDEALALKAKACFRLGSAQYEMGDYSDSIHSLEESIKSTNCISTSKENTPDSLVLRRLAQAKREQLKHAKRQRKKFKFALTPQSSGQRIQKQSDSALSTEASPSLESASLPSSETVGSTASIGAANVSISSISTPNLTRTTINTVTPVNSPALESRTGVISNEGSSKAPNLSEGEQHL